MSIDWTALGTVFGVSLGVTVGLVGLFTLGILGLAKRPAPAGQGHGADHPLLARTGAYLCFAVCAATIAYGLYLIVN